MTACRPFTPRRDGRPPPLALHVGPVPPPGIAWCLQDASTSSFGPAKPANISAGSSAFPSVHRRKLAASNAWKPSASSACLPPRSPGTCVPWRTTIRRSATPRQRGSRARPSSCGTEAREMTRVSVGVPGRLKTYALPLRAAAFMREPSAKKCRSGSSVSGTPGRGPQRSSRRRQTTSTTGPPVNTGAQGGFGARSQPMLALRNNHRLPSSR